MPLSKSELIMHPARLQILQALATDSLTTQQIAARLPDVPQSSIYRHLKLLLAGGMVQVAETRPVKGIQEKVYQLIQPPVLEPDDLAGLTADEHFSFFTTYVLTLLHGYAAYLAGVTGPEIDLVADRVGYREVVFWASEAELDAAMGALNQALQPLWPNQPAPGRRKRKLATILHPLNE